MSHPYSKRNFQTTPPSSSQDQVARPAQNKVHINPKFSANSSASTSSSSFNYVNYSQPGPSTSKVVHINPKFQSQQQQQKSSEAKERIQEPVVQKPVRKMHINPKFANRPLPSIPPPKPARNSLARSQSFSPSKAAQQHTAAKVKITEEPIYEKLKGPVIKIDESKKESFQASIKQAVEGNKVLVNPNFSGVVTRRAGGPPSKPMRHSLMVTSDVAKHLDLQLKKVKSTSVVSTPKTSVNKENLPSTSKTKMNLFTPLRKSAFKKIGSRKLIRRKSNSPGTPKASFKKIGNKKLIRVVNSEDKSGAASDSGSVYDVKTKTKIIKNVKNTPSNAAKYRFSFITPLSMKKSRSRVINSGSIKKSSGKKALSSFRSRFKLDRRQKLTKTEPKVLFQAPGQSKLKKMSGSTYRVSATKLSKVGVKAGAQGVAKTNAKVISVQGIKFSVADNGRKLRRLPSSTNQRPGPIISTNQRAGAVDPSESSPGLTGYSASVSGAGGGTSTSPLTDTGHNNMTGQTVDSGISSRNSPVAGAGFNTSIASSIGSKKMYIGGEELEEVEPGVFSRSRHSLTRASITQAKNRSINTILKNQTRSKQYCMFFNKFGKCTKKDAGNCPFIHDKEKIAVCRRFLQGSCHKDNCLLQHKVAPERMPVCKYFLEGVCSKESCPYLHVKVSENAAICPAFLAGYCKNGSDCKQRHIMACPEYDRLGVCSKPAGKCPFPHVNRAEKKVPPVKPKRKSLGQTPADHKKSRVQAAGSRYFDSASSKTEEATTAEGSNETEDTPEMEAKRKRLLRKIELAKAGWTGVSVSVVQEDEELDDSGPYEKIASDGEDNDGVEEEIRRPPVGQLGDFISLAGYSSEDEELHTDHRLI